MPFSTLDVTVGEMVALCDYDNDVDCRCTADFVKGAHCMLCGTLESATPEHITAHITSKPHQMRIQQYSTCARALLVHERTTIDQTAATASRREVVLMYLGSRIARADVIRGIGAYNTVAVNYLLRRCGTTDLLRAFGEITGTPHSLTRGLCSICLEHTSTVMFKSCKHMCACGPCSRRLASGGTTAKCPICRVESEIVSVFIT